MTSELERDFQDLVLYRIRALPPGTEISIGSVGDLSKKELLEHVRKMDDVGKTIISVEKEFFDALKSGRLHKIYET